MNNEREPIEDLIERSSLGNRDARRRRAHAPSSAVARVLAQAKAWGWLAPHVLPTERSALEARAKVPNAVIDPPVDLSIINGNGRHIPKKVAAPAPKQQLRGSARKSRRRPRRSRVVPGRTRGRHLGHASKPVLIGRRALVVLALALGLVLPGAARLLTTTGTSSTAPVVTNLLLNRSAPPVPGNAETGKRDHYQLSLNVWDSLNVLVDTVASERGVLVLWVHDSLLTTPASTVSFTTSRDTLDTARRQADARARISSTWDRLPTTSSTDLLATLGTIGEHLHQRRSEETIRQRLVLMTDWLPISPDLDTAGREGVGNPANMAEYREDPGSNVSEWDQQAITRLIAVLKARRHLPNLDGIKTWVVIVGYSGGKHQQQSMEVWRAVFNATGATIRTLGPELPRPLQ